MFVRISPFFKKNEQCTPAPQLQILGNSEIIFPTVASNITGTWFILVSCIQEVVIPNFGPEMRTNPTT